MKEVLIIFKPIAQKKYISTITKFKKVPNIFFDYEKIRQVIFNLVENAIKYTEKRGKIIVNLFRIKNELVFKIYNTGKKISEDNINKLFTPFFRIEKYKEKRTGLGLAICKGIIKQHNGKIWIENTENGPTFCFTLPIRAS